MPYSDNLYSANDESDAESFSEELSPSDGYFSRREMPTSGMVPDPSHHDRKTTEDKVLIPGHEARPNSGSASRTMGSSTLSDLYPSSVDASATNVTSSTPVSNTPSSPISSRQRYTEVSEHTPLFRAPPPAYSASDLSPPTLPEIRNYSTFPQEQLEPGYSAHHEPESMGRPMDDPIERSPLIGDSGDSGDDTPLPVYIRKKSSLSRVLIRKLLFFALVIAVIVALLTTMIPWSSNSNDNPPGHNPDGSGKTSAPYCSSATIKRNDNIILTDIVDNKPITIVQTTHDTEETSRSSYISTSGEIRLRRLPKDSTVSAHFSFDIRVSDPEIKIIRFWDPTVRTLRVSTPRRAQLKSYRQHCISLEITAWIPEHARYSDLRVASISLNLKVFDDLKASVSGSASFTSVSGDVSFPPLKVSKGHFPKLSAFEIPGHTFNSRKIDVETVSGSIKGVYPLYDHLGISSTSGTVAVGVFPHEIDPSQPLAAELIVSTTSGTINVHLPILALDQPKFKPPPRDYRTRVQSTSGGIYGSFYLGSNAAIEGTSGKLAFTIQPVLETSGKGSNWRTRGSQFETHTQSGSTEIEVREPIFTSLQSTKHPRKPDLGDDDPYLLLPPTDGELFDQKHGADSEEGAMRSLSCSHTTTSGSISVKYPLAYEGTIGAESITGKITITGDGVKTIREKNGFASKEVVAIKGVDAEGEGSMVALQSLTGSLTFDTYHG